MKNPHSPSAAWLHSVAGVGGYNESEPGDEGTYRVERGGHVFEVTVRNVTGEEE